MAARWPRADNLASSTPSRLAISTSFSIARWVSRASVGCAIVLLHGGVNHHALEIFALDRPRPMRHRKALLQQRGNLLLAQSLSPAR